MTTPVFGRRDPDGRGYFGEYGGRFVPETLVEPVEQLERAYREARADERFGADLAALLARYVGRPTPISEAARLQASLASDAGGGGAARLWLKREDLAHTGAHKINNALGQALLAVRMGKRRVVAETGAGQHGVATATACALLGLECVVYMGADDMARQALNVYRMRLLGATVTSVDAGSRTLKDAINEAMRDWVTNVGRTYYLLGSVLGPHPYPLMVREFQSVIGREARAQYRELAAFAQFASDLDETTRRQLERGQRVMEMMKQMQYAPMSISQMAVSLFAVDRGYLDDLPLDKIAGFEVALHGYMHAEHGELMGTIDETADFNDEIEAGLGAAVDSFKSTHAW